MELSALRVSAAAAAAEWMFGGFRLLIGRKREREGEGRQSEGVMFGMVWYGFCVVVFFLFQQ